MSIVRIAIIESPNPMDLFDERSEASALAASCKLIGHQAVAFLAKSRFDFQETCRYLASSASMHSKRNKKAPLFVHISSHGNPGCVAFGADAIDWSDLAEDLLPLYENEGYSGRVALALSACGSGENRISTHTKRALRDHPDMKVPKYIFSLLGTTVNWDDALMAWTLFYHKISSTGIENKEKVIAALESIQDCVGVQFTYRRWDEKTKSYFAWNRKKR